MYIMTQELTNDSNNSSPKLTLQLLKSIHDLE